MAELTPREPQSAADYDDRTTTAVKSVLIEIGQILGSFKGKFAVVGGAVPWLLLNNEVMPHVGSLDVDLSLDAEALGDGEYVTLIDALRGQGYEQREGLRRFQLVRKVPAKDGGAPIDIIVDFLMPRDAEIVRTTLRSSTISPCKGRMVLIWRCTSIRWSRLMGRCQRAERTASRSRSAPFPRCLP